MVVFEHGVNACGSIAAVMVIESRVGSGEGGVDAGSSLVRPESAQQRSALVGGPVPDNGL